MTGPGNSVLAQLGAAVARFAATFDGAALGPDAAPVPITLLGLDWQAWRPTLRTSEKNETSISWEELP